MSDAQPIHGRRELPLRPHALEVLIVEDEPILRSVIARNLRARGHRVREADTAARATEELLTELPDLLLLDIGLPDRTGWDVMRELRTSELQVQTVVISAVRVSAERLAEFQPASFLPKPFPLEALLKIVERAARKRRKQD